MASLAEWERADRERRLERFRAWEIDTGHLVIGGAGDWFASLHYSDQVWDVLKDRRWRREQAAML